MGRGAMRVFLKGSAQWERALKGESSRGPRPHALLTGGLRVRPCPQEAGGRKLDGDTEAGVRGAEASVLRGLESTVGSHREGSKALSGAALLLPSGARDPGIGHGRPQIRQSRGREAGIMQGERRYSWTPH